MPKLALLALLILAGGADALFSPRAGEVLTLDLGSVHQISGLALVPRPLAHGYCARDFRLLASLDAVHWSELGTFAKPAGQQRDAWSLPRTEARYLRLWIVTSWETAPDANSVQIAEVEVLDPEGRNLAAGAKLSAGSQEARHPVEHANDGDPATFWVSAGQVVNQPVWILTPDMVEPRDAAGASRLLPELFERFRAPGNSWRPKMIWFFNETPDDASSTRQLEEMKAAGLAGPAIFAYRGLPTDYYLSDRWLASIGHVVEECGRLGLDAWILDEGSYPSGFADGRVTDDAPQFRSKALRVAHEQLVAEGETFEWTAGAEPVVAILASRPGDWQGDATPRDLTDLLRDGRIAWECEDGPWVVRALVQRLESHAARAVSTGGRKDHTHSLPDYLRRDATARFLEVTHEAYERTFGEAFGGVVKGFFGDEPCLPRLPWTDAFPQRFLERKGYDIRPHLGALLGAPDPDREGVLYDYYEVLAGLWRSEFYEPQTAWCAERGMTYTAHLCGEENMPGLIRELDADFFASEAGIGEPGVDVIWRQVFPGCASDFPKLAGSAANVWGKPRAMTESFAVFGTGTTYAQTKYVTDYQLARGVDDFFLMAWSYSVEGWRRLMHPPDFSPDSTLYPFLRGYSDYVGRCSLIASEGVPIAPVGVYYPTRSAWIGDDAGLEGAHAIGRMLLERQVGFEWLDDNALAECCTPAEGGMRNRSGSLHRVLLVPSTRVMGPEAATRVVEFARAGGVAIFVGEPPARWGGLGAERPELAELLAEERTPLGAGEIRRVGSVEEAVALARELTGGPTEEPVPMLRMSGAEVEGGELWLATNEGTLPIEAVLRLPAGSAVERWDPESGTVRTLNTERTDSASAVRLSLPPSGLAVLAVAPGEATAEPSESFREVATLEAGWRWGIGDSPSEARALTDWSTAGRPEYSGEARYETTLSLERVPEGRLVLDLGDVRYMVRVEVNGVDAGRRIWPPYALDVTGLLHPGDNELCVWVTNTPANRFFARPEDRARAQEAGWFEGTYVGTYERFEADSLRSGLLGPVRLLAAEAP